MNKHLIDDDVDLQKVGKTPILLTKAILSLILVLTVIWGSIYISQLDRIEGKPIDFGYVDTGLVWVDISSARGIEVPGVNPQIILSSTPELIAKGKELYTSSCASCHGDAGDGNGPASGTLNPKPRNYKQAEGWTNGKKFSDLYKTLQEGIQSRGMAAYEYIKPEDRIGILHYIRTTFGGFPDITADDVKLLEEKYSLSKGMRTPNNIPVVNAIGLVVKENANKNSSIKTKADLIIKPTSGAAELAKKVTKCPEKAISFCLNSNEVLASKDNFVKYVSSSINQNGFNAKFLKLNNSEMTELYSFLNGLVK
jgi:mono/diheme cytochrome c family protein